MVTSVPWVLGDGRERTRHHATLPAREDLLDEAAPRPGRRGSGSAPAPAAGLALARSGCWRCSPCCSTRPADLSLEAQVLLYLLAVVVIAVVGGSSSAVAPAIASALLINWFFVEPVHTLESRIATRPSRSWCSSSSRRSSAAPSSSPRAARRGRAGPRARPRRSRRWPAPTSTRGDAAGGARTRAADLRHGVGRAEVRDRSDGEWIDVEQAGWAAPGTRGAAALRRPDRAGPATGRPRPRAVRGGPARAATRSLRPPQTAYEGRRLSAQAKEAGRSRPSTGSAPRSWPPSATTCARRWPASRPRSARCARRRRRGRRRPRRAAGDDRGRRPTASRPSSPTSSTPAACRPARLSVQARGRGAGRGGRRGRPRRSPRRGEREVDVPEDLPLVLADPGLLERVLVNLLDNALRHGGTTAPSRSRARRGRERQARRRRSRARRPRGGARAISSSPSSGSTTAAPAASASA